MTSTQNIIVFFFSRDFGAAQNRILWPVPRKTAGAFFHPTAGEGGFVPDLPAPGWMDGWMLPALRNEGLNAILNTSPGGRNSRIPLESSGVNDKHFLLWKSREWVKPGSWAPFRCQASALGQTSCRILGIFRISARPCELGRRIRGICGGSGEGGCASAGSLKITEFRPQIPQGILAGKSGKRTRRAPKGGYPKGQSLVKNS